MSVDILLKQVFPQINGRHSGDRGKYGVNSLTGTGDTIA